MKRRGLALCAGVLLLGLLPGSVLAKPGVDQQMTDCTTGFGSHPFAQTFTTGMTGTLTGVDLNLTETSKKSITVSIFSAPFGTPTGLSLASGSTTVNFSGWYSFDFSIPLSVTAERKYAIVFDVGTGSACGSNANKYLRGEALVQNPTWSVLTGADFAFKTYMLAPLPTATPSPVPTPAPTPPPAPAATPLPTTAPGATATPASTASTSPADASGSAEPSATDTSTSTASPTTADSGTSGSPSAGLSAAATPATGSSDTGGSSGSALPIILGAILVLAAVGGGIGFVLWRRRRLGPRT
jgi:hypothetical protein